MPATRFRNIPRLGAISVALLTLAAMGVLWLVAVKAGAPGGAAAPITQDDGDLALYQRIVQRLHAGEAYYPTVHSELTTSGYGSLSVFNWRTPLYMSAVALAPSLGWAQAVLGILAIGAIVLAYAFFRASADRALAFLLILILVLGLAETAVTGTVLFSEVTAGVLILISVSAYGLKLPWIGLAAGAVALFVRELAAPYIVICAAVAWRERRYRELAGWGIVLIAYAGYFTIHLAMIDGMIGSGDRADPQGWLQLGGLTSVLRTASFNGVLSLLPLPVTAIVLPLGLLGLLAWPGVAGLRVAATVIVYTVLFAFVGKPTNLYWGALYTPLLTLGLPWAVAAAADLWKRAR
jgi:hypothetical protein